jgi:uncharacterized protein (DUF488 family)
MTPAPAVLTIGHGARAWPEFLALLKVHEVGRLWDVRRFPRSGRHPHFDGAAIARALAEARNDYAHRPGLGGFRRPDGSALNAALAESAYRGFADYMQTPEFARELDALVVAAAGARLAILCAESDPAHCHRGMIADALLVRGVPVEHIRDAAPPLAHVLSASARTVGGRLHYPGAQTRLEFEAADAGVSSPPLSVEDTEPASARRVTSIRRQVEDSTTR